RIFLASMAVIVIASIGVNIFGAIEPEPKMDSSAEKILSSLRHEHPRLIARAADFAEINKIIGRNRDVKMWYEHLQAEGEKILQEEPSKYEIPDGLRLLATSRRVLERARLLALLYRLNGDKRFAERAWKNWKRLRNFRIGTRA